MIKYLLDASTCIALTSGNESVRRRLLLEAQSAVAISTIVVFELDYGVYKSQAVAKNQLRLSKLLGSVTNLLSFNRRDADFAGMIRAELQARNEPIGPYDTLIAGQAMARGLTLVTANVREFERVRGLRWEDWALL